MRRPYILVQKTSGFTKFMVCLHEQGKKELSQFEHFANKGGGGSIFRDLVRTSFMNCPLGYFKMTTLLALKLKNYLFFEMFKTLPISNFFKWLAQKATGAKVAVLKLRRRKVLFSPGFS